MLGRFLFRVKVSGESCWPDLVPGKSYPASRLRAPGVGDYVVFPDPIHEASTSGWWVKKIKRIDGNILHVGGTVSWSSSCTVPRIRVLGTILKRHQKETEKITRDEYINIFLRRIFLCL